MKKINFVFCCVAAVAVNMVICTSSQAQRAIENANEFMEKAVEQAEDGNVRRPSNSNAQIEWDDTTVSNNRQSQQPQQDQ